MLFTLPPLPWPTAQNTLQINSPCALELWRTSASALWPRVGGTLMLAYTLLCRSLPVCRLGVSRDPALLGLESEPPARVGVAWWRDCLWAPPPCWPPGYSPCSSSNTLSSSSDEESVWASSKWWGKADSISKSTSSSLSSFHHYITIF